MTRSFAIAMSVLSLLTAIPAWADCEPLHPSVRIYLEANPEWSIVELKDLVADDQRLWQDHKRDQCPGMAVVDLDGSGKSSYALALLRHERGETFERLVVVTAGKPQTLDASQKIGNPAVVWRGEPGVYVEFSTRHKTRIAHDTIIYERFEASARAYYLSHGKFRSILTTD